MSTLKELKEALRREFKALAPIEEEYRGRHSFVLRGRYRSMTPISVRYGLKLDHADGAVDLWVYMFKGNESQKLVEVICASYDDAIDMAHKELLAHRVSRLNWTMC